MENNYQLSRIHNYVHGLMSKEEMHALEREALEDPLLQDAIDGYTLQDGVDAGQLSLLQKRLSDRIETQALAKNKRFYSWQRLAIGMAAAVMFVSVSILLLIKYIPHQHTGLSEVDIMQDHTYSISVKPYQEGAEPTSGWSDYEDYLNKNYKGERYKEGLMHIAFKIDGEGKPVDIQEQTNGPKHPSFEELRTIIQRGPAWKGEQGHIVIDVHKMKF